MSKFNQDNFEELPFKDKFKIIFKEYKKQIEENILYDILCRFYFADWTRACDYQNMTSEQLVEAVMSICHQLEKDYNYDFDDDIIPTPF